MTKFTFRSFLRDRRPYILVYTVFGLLTVAVVQLDLLLNETSLHYTNLIYLFILGLVGLTIFLAVDYRRQANFFRQLTSPQGERTLDEMSLLDQPITLEQQLYADAWERLYAQLRSELSEERHRTERRLHFLSQWAHHMKTPVAVIDLELQKARRDSSPATEELVNSIAEENERLRASLQALLNTIRLDDFASDFKLEPVDLVNLAREVINEYRHAFIAHSVFPKLEEPDQSLPRELLTPASDAKWLRLIMEQVVSNAIKYSAQSGRDGRVTIRFEIEENQTILEIADNGIGIPPEDLGRLFVPFFTGTAGRRDPTATGLGLYLAREASVRLGHTLTVRSAPGEGTKVRIGFKHDTSIFASLKGDLTVK